jgi:hypothetical protein
MELIRVGDVGWFRESSNIVVIVAWSIRHRYRGCKASMTDTMYCVQLQELIRRTVIGLFVVWRCCDLQAGGQMIGRDEEVEP